MLRINPQVYDNLDSYIASWQKDKIVTIVDLLEVTQADALHSYLLNLHDDQWSHSIHPYINDCYTFDNTVENQHPIEKGIISARAAHDRGEFSYHFRRFEGYMYDGIKIKEFLLSSQFVNLLMQITGVTAKSLVSVFASQYSGGNWLSTHSDGSRGFMAFVYNLTKDWNDQNGGHFHMLNDDWCSIKRRVTPKFNSFTFFDVSNGGKPHFVEMVKDGVTDKRIAFSGWLEK